MHKRSKNITAEQLSGMLALYDNGHGLSCTKIAKQSDLHPTTVQKLFRRHGVIVSNSLSIVKPTRRCRICKLIKPSNEFAAHSAKRWPYCKTCEVVYRYNYKYGISEDVYNELLEKQAYKCAICGVTHDTSCIRGYKKLNVDHDHTTGQVRGLLCGACNKAIGLLKDRADVARQAANYLDNTLRIK